MSPTVKTQNEVWVVSAGVAMGWTGPGAWFHQQRPGHTSVDGSHGPGNWRHHWPSQLRVFPRGGRREASGRQPLRCRPWSRPGRRTQQAGGGCFRAGPASRPHLSVPHALPRSPMQLWGRGWNLDFSSEVMPSQWLTPGPRSWSCSLIPVAPSTGFKLGPLSEWPQVATDTSLPDTPLVLPGSPEVRPPGPNGGTQVSEQKRMGNLFQVQNPRSIFLGKRSMTGSDLGEGGWQDTRMRKRPLGVVGGSHAPSQQVQRQKAEARKDTW